MGRRKPTTAELKATVRELAEEMEGGDDAELTIREIESEIDATPEDVRWNVHVSRVKANSKYEPFLFSCDPSEMAGLRERLRDRYGTGLYRVRVRKNGQIARQYDLAVEQENAAPNLGGSRGLEDIIARVVDMMDARFAKIEERLGKPDNQVDELTRFKTIAEILASLRTGSAAAPGTSMNEMLGFFTAALNLGKELAGGGDGGGVAETNLADVAKEFVKSGGLEKIGEALTARVRPPPIVQVAPTAIAPPVAQGIMDAAPQMNGQKVTRPSPAALIGPKLAAEMETLIAAARRESNVSLYAEYLSDSLPDPALAYILNNDRVLEDLEKAFPEVAQLRPWFSALLNEILQMNQEEGEQPRAANIPGDDPGRRGGDPGDAQAHAPNGANVAESPAS